MRHQCETTPTGPGPALLSKALARLGQFADGAELRAWREDVDPRRAAERQRSISRSSMDYDVPGAWDTIEGDTLNPIEQDFMHGSPSTTVEAPRTGPTSSGTGGSRGSLVLWIH